ncbi:LacI family DNA-binding transcriptional regulator [Peribacillus sp. NPDC101481]|uniref:LacI family DNA-binding transcriptional regulator n=1 Tax=Peribacillus sp. NPDC101481 TaxID=3364403 RepID=UPI001D87F7A5|nr:HTH-type transcriptional regulator MalR [Peribacillus sp. Bi134]
MAITIKDVEKLANVATFIISQLNADDTRISEKTKVRVRKAMQKLGYHPNFIKKV